MTTDQNDSESGSSLRDQLEATIAKNKSLSEALAKATVTAFKYVKAEDLNGVEPDQFATKAAEIEQTRKTQAEELAKQFLAEKFGADVDLDSIIPKAGDESTAGGEDAASRLASVGNETGTPVTHQPVVPTGDPLASIRAALGD